MKQFVVEYKYVSGTVGHLTVVAPNKKEAKHLLFRAGYIAQKATFLDCNSTDLTEVGVFESND